MTGNNYSNSSHIIMFKVVKHHKTNKMFEKFECDTVTVNDTEIPNNLLWEAPKKGDITGWSECPNLLIACGFFC